jgi:hypothetical protein
MKLIKIMLAGMVLMAFGFGQGNQGPPPCDQWLNSDMAHDMNGDGTVDEGDCPGQGPPRFEDVDTNGDGSIDREEARAMFGHDKDGNPDPEFDAEYDRISGDDGEVDHDEFMAAGDGDRDGDHEGRDGDDGPPRFEDVDTNGDGSIDREEARAMFGHDKDGNPDPEFDAEYDRIAGDDGMVDHAEYMAADDGGGGTCDECGHEYTGAEGEEHGHCNYEYENGDRCGDENNTAAEWEEHRNEYPDHFPDDGGGDHDGGPRFEDVDANGDGLIDRDEARAMFGHDEEGNPDPEFDAEYDRIAGDDGMVDHDEFMAAGDGGPPTNHWDGNCGAMKHGESEYWLDSDGDPNNGAEDGPYAVWYEDADGNPVDCQPPPNDGNQN